MRALGVVLLLTAVACVETDTPRAYACSGAAGECPGGFICGLEGYCRDPAVEGPFKCARDSGFGCADRWFCTVEEVCRSRDAGGEIACTRTNPDGDPKDGGLPNDCGNPAWWCGHDRVCQEVGVERGYSCATDNDCEGSWRCSTDGRCIPRPADSLNTATFPNAGAPVLVSPLQGAFGATHVAVGASYSNTTINSPDAGSVRANVSVAAYADGGLVGFFRDEDKNDGIGRVQLTRSPTGVSNLRELGFIECRVYAIRDGAGGVSEFQVASATNPDDGGLPSVAPIQTVATLGPGAQLRTANRNLGFAAAFTQTEWSVHGFGLCGWPYTADKRPLPGRGIDLAWLGIPQLAVPGVWVLSTEQGLFLIKENKQDFEQEDWRALGGAYAPNDLCGPTAPGIQIRHQQLKTLSQSVLASHVTLTSTTDAGASFSGLMVYVLYLPPGFFPYETTFSDGGMLFPKVSDGGCTNAAYNLIPAMEGPCPPCSAAYPHLVDYSPFVGSQADGGLDVYIEGRCSQLPNAAGGHEIFALENKSAFASQNCRRTVLRREPNAGIVIGHNNSQRIGRAARRGGVWVGDTESFVEPILMDEAPEMLIRTVKGDQSLASNNRFVAEHQQDFGFVPLVIPGGVNDFSAQVEGKPSWIAANDGVYSVESYTPIEGRAVASPPVEGFRQQSVGRGVILYGRDGGAELLVSSFDTLYSADVGGVLDGGGEYGQLEFRMIPQPQVGVTALAASSPGPQDTFFARAYARLASGVVELRAETRTSWRVADTGLSGNPLTVFSTGLHARAGYDDGSVYSLPSRLLLAPPLLPEHQPASSFASACGQPWVIARGGVFKLVVDGNAAVGRWEKVNIEAGLAERELLATPVDLFERGRLNPRGRELWIFLGDGTTFRVPLSCGNGG